MGTKKQAVDFLNKQWQRASLDLVSINHELRQMEENKKACLEHLRGLLAAFEAVGAEPQTAIPSELRIDKDVSIGDAMEKMLRERGPIEKTILRGELTKAGVLTGKNTRIILANAIKRDGKERFGVENGKVFLIGNQLHAVALEQQR